MPRLLILSLLFSPDGVSTAHEVTEIAIGLRERGHEVTVIAGTPHYNVDADFMAKQPLHKRCLGLLYKSKVGGVEVYHVPILPKGNRVYSRLFDYVIYHVYSMICGLALVGKQDLILGVTPPPTIGLNAWLLARLKRIPFVYNIREMFPDVLGDMGLIRNNRFLSALERIEKHVYRNSDANVVITNFFYRELLRKGAPPEKIHIIPNLTDVDFIRPGARENDFSSRYALNDKFVIQYAGNIGLTQGFEIITDAAEALQDHQDIHFLIVGGGAKYGWLESEIRKRDMGNITLLPYQPRSMVPKIYASADICLIPLKGNTAKTTIPSKIYTVMAAGKPALVSVESDSELAWVVNEANCGWVVSPDSDGALVEGILHAYASKDELGKMGERGRAFVEVEYSIKAVVEKYDHLLGMILGQE